MIVPGGGGEKFEPLSRELGFSPGGWLLIKLTAALVWQGITVKSSGNWTRRPLQLSSATLKPPYV